MKSSIVMFVKVDFQSNISKPSMAECSAIELTSFNIIIICIYRPCIHLRLNYDAFLSILRDILEYLSLKPKSKVIICGDFNINILEPNKLSKEFEQLLDNYNMKFQFKQITRSKSKTCLDNIIHNHIRGCKGEIVEHALSDHSSQIFTVPVKKTCTLKFWYTQKRDFSSDNLNKFKECLRQLTFYDVYNCEEPNTAFENFYEMFLLLYNLCFPINNKKIFSKKRPKWITKGILLCSKRRRDMLWKYRLYPTKDNKRLFKQYSIRYKKIMNLTQKIQNNHFIKNAKSKSRATWSIINKQKFNIPKDHIKKINIDGVTITDPEVIAQKFNDFFIDIASPGFPPNLNNYKIDHDKSNSIFLTPTIPNDILNIIDALKTTESFGYDGVTTKTVKFVSEEIAPVISYIINLCIQKGVFPQKLKITIVKPVFKKGDKDKLDHYRPIALIPIIAKIFEKVLYDKLNSYLEAQNILSHCQYGFRKKKDINMAIYNFLNEVILGMNNNNLTAALFMDMSKAFDRVDYKILLNKLSQYGIRGTANSLFKSYLTDRLQMTQINGICLKTKSERIYSSNLKKVLYGVPQGSVLGPLLFLMYINDLPKATPHSVTLFADDSTVLFKNGKRNKNNIASLCRDINSTLVSIINWLDMNNLKVNLDKTNVINFRQRQSKSLNENLDITYSGHKIDEVGTTKFLGLHIDSKLDWKLHTDIVSKKVIQFSFALYKLRQVADQDTLLTAYHGHVMSTLRYGLIFWGNSTDVEVVFRAQKRCIRAICGLRRRESCKPHFIELRLLTLPCIYISEIALFVKKNFHLFPTLLGTRHKNNLACPSKMKTSLMTKSVLGGAPIIYNKLPADIRNCEDVMSFKNELNKYLAAKAYYSLKMFVNDNN